MADRLSLEWYFVDGHWTGAQCTLDTGPCTGDKDNMDKDDLHGHLTRTGYKDTRQGQVTRREKGHDITWDLSDGTSGNP